VRPRTQHRAVQRGPGGSVLRFETGSIQSRPVARSVLFGLLAALVLAPAAWAQNGGIGPPDSATDSGDAINQVYWVIFAAAVVVFLIIESALILFVVRYRRRRTAPEHVEGPQIHGNTRVEIIWTVIPTLALAAIAAFTFLKVTDVQATPDGGEGDVVVEVSAHQFYWQYRYENGALSFDTLYLPVDRTVTLVLRSADVNHSWWVPELTGKRDAIPGVTNKLHFRPHDTGTFANGVCGEFCGIQHARMTTTVVVLEQGAWEQWLDENATADPVRLGEAEWVAACSKCHGLEGQGDEEIGPAIAGNGTLTNLEGLDRLLRREGQNLEGNPGFMPPVGKGWTDAQLEALVAYVQSNPRLSGEDQGGG
jgi:cytochrome c oxidase subunit 2